MSQQSIASLPENQQDAVLTQTAQASHDFPSVEVAGHLVHVCQLHGTWEVWVNCEDADFTGLCVSTGDTRDEAVREALSTLHAIVAHLQQCP